MSTLRFGSRTVRQDRALVMAIVNRTRDSCYDHGATFGVREALAAVDEVARTRKVVEMVASTRGTRPPARCPRALA